MTFCFYVAMFIRGSYSNKCEHILTLKCTCMSPSNITSFGDFCCCFVACVRACVCVCVCVC